MNERVRTQHERRWSELAEIDSSSRELRRVLDRDARVGDLGSEYRLVAETQRAGVGRFGRIWSSPHGGLWMSFALPLLDPLSRVAEGDRQATADAALRALAIRIAYAVREAILATAPKSAAVSLDRLRLKWPNDLVVLAQQSATDASTDRFPTVGAAHRKVGGILIERTPLPATSGAANNSTASDWLILGVGINANMSAALLPEELRDSATTLQHEFQAEWDLASLADSITSNIRNAVRATTLSDATQAIESFKNAMVGLNATATVSNPDGSRIAATLIDLHPETGLAVIRDARGKVRTVEPGAVIMHA